MKKIGNVLMITMFLAFVFGIGLLTIFSPPKETSFFENRALAERPIFTKELLMSGEYFKSWETYVVDHIVKRDVWVKTYKDYEIRSGNIEVGNYYITPDNWILAKPLMEIPTEEMDHSAMELNELGTYLKKQGTEFYFMFLPNKMTTIQLSLPSYMIAGKKKEYKEYFLSKINQEEIKTFDMGEQFEAVFETEELNQMFFKTDHHWNMNGASTGFQYVLDNIDQNTKHPFNPQKSSEDFKMECVEDKRLLGSWNKQLYGLIDSSDEKICYYNPQTFSFDDFEVYEGEMNKENLIDWQSLYGMGLEEKEDRIDYATAYMADYREINIMNPKNTEAPNVLIIKDSYVDPITFHFGQYFNRTTIFDIRFNQDRSVYDYLKLNDFDMVVILYNDTNVQNEMYDFDLSEIDSE
jgi:hypothetical protein